MTPEDSRTTFKTEMRDTTANDAIRLERSSNQNFVRGKRAPTTGLQYWGGKGRSEGTHRESRRQLLPVDLFERNCRHLPWLRVNYLQARPKTLGLTTYGHSALDPKLPSQSRLPILAVISLPRKVLSQFGQRTHFGRVNAPRRARNYPLHLPVANQRGTALVPKL